MFIRRSTERGHADHGWLRSQHSFSFANYYDPRFMGFGDLRVINEDRVSPGRGFGAHPHRDMEIISYVLDGALEHRDSTGTGSVIRPDDVQIMSAGAGISHSEFNHSREAGVHFLQIWIQPAERGLAPQYDEATFERTPNTLQLLISPDGRDGSLRIRQDARLYRAILDPGQALTLELAANRRGWLQIIRGRLTIDDVETLNAGDAAALEVEDVVARVRAADERAEFLFFDLR